MNNKLISFRSYIMADQTVSTHSFTSQAALESSVASGDPFDLFLMIDCDDLNEYEGELWRMLSQWCTGMGKVDLFELSVSYLLPGANDYLHVGTSTAYNTQTAKQLSRLPSGVNANGGNMLNRGKQFIDVLIPDGQISRQLQPASSDLPMLRIAYSKSASCQLSLFVKLKTQGHRKIAITLTSTGAVEEQSGEGSGPGKV